MVLFNEYDWERIGNQYPQYKFSIIPKGFTKTFWEERRIKKAGRNCNCTKCDAFINQGDLRTGGYERLCRRCSIQHCENLIVEFNNGIRKFQRTINKLR